MNMQNRNTSLQNIIKSIDPLRNNGNYGLKTDLVNHKNLLVEPGRGLQLNYSTLINKFGLKPPEDLSAMIGWAFGAFDFSSY
jgi:hypothetical protein